MSSTLTTTISAQEQQAHSNLGSISTRSIPPHSRLLSLDTPSALGSNARELNQSTSALQRMDLDSQTDGETAPASPAMTFVSASVPPTPPRDPTADLDYDDYKYVCCGVCGRRRDDVETFYGCPNVVCNESFDRKCLVKLQACPSCNEPIDSSMVDSSMYNLSPRPSSPRPESQASPAAQPSRPQSQPQQSHQSRQPSHPQPQRPSQAPPPYQRPSNQMPPPPPPPPYPNALCDEIKSLPIEETFAEVDLPDIPKPAMPDRATIAIPRAKDPQALLTELAKLSRVLGEDCSTAAKCRELQRRAATAESSIERLQHQIKHFKRLVALRPQFDYALRVHNQLAVTQEAQARHHNVVTVDQVRLLSRKRQRAESEQYRESPRRSKSQRHQGAPLVYEDEDQDPAE